MAGLVKRFSTGLLVLTCATLCLPAPLAGAVATDNVIATTQLAGGDNIIIQPETASPSADSVGSIEASPAAEAIEGGQVEAPIDLVLDRAEAGSTEVTQATHVTGSSDEDDDHDAVKNQPDDTPVELLISKLQVGSNDSPTDEFIEIYNPSDEAVLLTGVRLEFLTANHNGVDSPTRTIKLLDSATIPSQGYYVLASPGYLEPGRDDVFADIQTPSSGYLAASGSVRLMDGEAIVDLVGWGGAKQYLGQAISSEAIKENLPLERCVDRTGLLVDTENNRQDFAIYSHEIGILLHQSVVCPTAVEPSPTNSCAGLRLSEIGANLSDQFVEVVNTSETTVELAGCRLTTNRNKTQHIYKSELLEPGAYKVVYIKNVDLNIIKTTTAIIYLLSEDGKTEVDSTEYDSLSANTSWALIGEAWKQTYAPTPGAVNLYQQYLPCDKGYTRNTDTGRCNKLASASQPQPCAANQFRNPATGRCKLTESGSTLAPCRDGQYRHPETNRCRNIASTANVLTPCRPGQERNPETNRCRSIAATASVLKPCGPGQERNPETNRCRKSQATAAIAGAEFPVEAIEDVGSAFVGWWALGGALMLGLGYAGWEWRHEVVNMIRRNKA